MDEAVAHFENNSKNKTALTRASTVPISQPHTLVGSSLVQTKSMNAVGSSTEPVLPVPQPASIPANQIYHVNLLIPEALSKSKNDLFISVRVTAIQTLQDICRGIRPHLVDDDIWFSLHDASEQQQQIPQELPLSTKISLISPQSSSEFTLLVHGRSRTIELTVNCLGKRGRQEQPIKLIVKPTQTCRKMIEKIATHVGASQSSCIFTFQGRKIKSTDTFQDLKIGNGSQIIMTTK